MADMNSVVGKTFSYILDNKGKVPEEISKALKVGVNTVSASCSELFRTGFVTREPKTMPGTNRMTYAYTAVKTISDAEKASTFTGGRSNGPIVHRRRGKSTNSKATLTALVTLQVGRNEALTMGMEDFVALYRDMQSMAKAFGLDK